MTSVARLNAPATPKQLIALFFGTGLNTKGMSISINKASNLISDMKSGIDITQELLDLGATGTPKKRAEDFQELYNKANAAGMEAVKIAVEKQQIQPMGIVGYGLIADGECGFAWIVTAGNTSFGKWLTKKKLASKHYPSGICVWVHYFNQSRQKKAIYAEAFAKVLNENGIKAYADSRVD